MSESTFTVPPTPEAAAQERGFLLQDAGFRDRAMNPAGREWHQLQALDRVIHGIPDTPANDEQPTAEPAALRPDDYDFSAVANFARSSGVELDPVQDRDLRGALSAAGVDQGTAAAAYLVAVEAAANPRDEAQAMRDLDAAQQALRSRWGPQYDERMSLAVAESRRLFDALPASFKAGRDYETFMDQTGLGRSATLFEQLAERAKARGRK